VPEQPDPRGIDLGAAAQEREPGERVTGQVVVARLLQIAGRAPHAAVVHPQHGVPGARERVGEQQERLVSRDGLVAVLRAAPGDHQDGGEGSAGGREGERPGHGQVAARVRHLLAAVGERRLRLLRPPRRGQHAAGQRERDGLAALAVAAGDRPRVAQRAVERGPARDVGQPERDRLAVEPHVVQRQRAQALGGEVERATVARQAHPEVQRRPRGLDAAVPVAADVRRCLRRRRGTCGEEQHRDEPEDRPSHPHTVVTARTTGFIGAGGADGTAGSDPAKHLE
jgi:hypothetical protein